MFFFVKNEGFCIFLIFGSLVMHSGGYLSNALEDSSELLGLDPNTPVHYLFTFYGPFMFTMFDVTIRTILILLSVQLFLFFIFIFCYFIICALPFTSFNKVCVWRRAFFFRAISLKHSHNMIWKLFIKSVCGRRCLFLSKFIKKKVNKWF